MGILSSWVQHPFGAVPTEKDLDLASVEFAPCVLADPIGPELAQLCSGANGIRGDATDPPSVIVIERGDVRLNSLQCLHEQAWAFRHLHSRTQLKPPLDLGLTGVREGG